MKPLKVNLDVASDKDLRNYIKELIDSQVKSITRETISEIVREEYESKLKSNLNKYNDNKIQDMVSKHIDTTIRCVSGRINDGNYCYLTDFGKQVGNILNTKVEQFASEIIEKAKDNVLSEDNIKNTVKDKIENSSLIVTISPAGK